LDRSSTSYFMAKKNKYVNFVSDVYFEYCVEHILNAYFNRHSNLGASIKKNKSNVFASKFFDNTIDPFKILVVSSLGSGSNGKKMALKAEFERQADKTFEQTFGQFHQRLLGGAFGWVDFGNGHKLKIDLGMLSRKSRFWSNYTRLRGKIQRKPDSEVILREYKALISQIPNNDWTKLLELKNKHNTVNSSSMESALKKLKSAEKRCRKAKSYFAYVLPKYGVGSGQHLINGRTHIFGNNLYQLVTGDKKGLLATYLALKKCLKKSKKYKRPSNKDVEILLKRATNILDELPYKTFYGL